MYLAGDVRCAAPRYLDAPTDKDAAVPSHCCRRPSKIFPSFEQAAVGYGQIVAASKRRSALHPITPVRLVGARLIPVAVLRDPCRICGLPKRAVNEASASARSGSMASRPSSHLSSLNHSSSFYIRKRSPSPQGHTLAVSVERGGLQWASPPAAEDASRDEVLVEMKLDLRLRCVLTLTTAPCPSSVYAPQHKLRHDDIRPLSAQPTTTSYTVAP